MNSSIRSLALLAATLTVAAACTATAPTPPVTSPSAGASASATPGAAASATPTPAAQARVADLDWEEDADDLALGLSVSGVDADGGTDEDGDGDLDYRARGDVSVGGESHEVDFVEQDEPIMGDDPDVAVLKDKTSGDVLTFSADQEFNTFSARQPNGDQLKVEFNADGSITVNGQQAATVDAAADMIVASSVGTDASLQSLGFLHGVLERRDREATRGNPDCVISGSASRSDKVYRIRQADSDELTELSADAATLDSEADAADAEPSTQAGDEQDLSAASLNSNGDRAIELVAAVLRKRQGK